MGGLNQVSRSVPNLPNIVIPDLVNSGLSDEDKINNLIDTVNKLIEYARASKEVTDSLIKRAAEFSDHSEQVAELWNKGRLQLREFTSAPVLADLAVKEIAYRTNGSFYVKESTTTISVFTRASTIT